MDLRQSGQVSKSQDPLPPRWPRDRRFRRKSQGALALAVEEAAEAWAVLEPRHCWVVVRRHCSPEGPHQVRPAGRLAL